MLSNYKYLALAFPLLYLFSLPLEKWEVFRSEKGCFEILSPGELTEKTDTTATGIGEIIFHNFFFQPPEENADNVLYKVSYWDYPEGSMHSDSLDLLADFFAATVESSTRSVRGKIFYQSDIQWKGFPGKIWRVHL